MFGTQKILAAIAALSKKVDALMSDQSHLDAQVAQIVAGVAALNTAATDIEAEIAALKAANPAVDFTALDAAVASLGSAVTAVQADDQPAAPPAV
jgi:predicted negative regulator of RcsB-dependent stress response